MRRNVLIALNSIYLLFAGVVIGVPLGIGAIVAPVVFRHFGQDKASAGAIVGRAFEMSGTLSILILSLMLAVAAVEFSYRRRTNTKRLLIVRWVLNLVPLLVNLYLTESLLPVMNLRQRLGDQRMFMELHGEYRALTWVSIVLCAGLIAITQAVNIGPRRDGGHPRQV
ncbi:MAG TPA: DUF4149 domain-containing protein [Armatimonadota bacterium]|jgi:hypothetical protein